MVWNDWKHKTSPTNNGSVWFTFTKTVFVKIESYFIENLLVFWFTDTTREFFFCHVVNWVRLSCQKAIGIFLLGQKIMDGLQGGENSTMTTGRSYIVLIFFFFLILLDFHQFQLCWLNKNIDLVLTAKLWFNTVGKRNGIYCAFGMLQKSIILSRWNAVFHVWPPNLTSNNEIIILPTKREEHAPNCWWNN